MIRKTSNIFFFLLVLLTSGKTSATTSPSATPDSVSILVEKAEISRDDINYTTVIENQTSPVDLTSDTNPVFGQKADIPVGTYRVIRLTVNEISWHATWSIPNPSPCNGTSSGEATGTVDLGGHAEFYFKTPDLGGNTLAYYLANPPVSPAAYVGDATHPFVLASPIQVIPDNGGKTPTTVNLVIGVANTITCDGLKMIDITSGSPSGVLTGPSTRLTDADGIYFDSVNQEIYIANRRNNSLTVFDRGTLGDAPPKRILIGPSTRLNQPAGLAVYHDPTSTPQQDKDEIFVANLGSDSVTVYSRTAIGNVPPLRTIVGTQTGLSRPTGVAVYHDPASTPSLDKDDIFVANSGNDSITAYSRLSSENAAPFHTFVSTTVSTAVNGVQEDVSSLSNPCALSLDPYSNFLVVANSGNSTVTIYLRTDSSWVSTTWTNFPFQIPCGIALYPPNHIYLGKGIFIDTHGDTDSTNDEIGSLGSVPEPVMAFSPAISPSNANASASTSNLVGEYNVVLYGVDLQGVNGHGIIYPVLFSERGKVSFDPTTTPWPSFTIRRDEQIRRQVIQPDCQQEQDFRNPKVGIYGVNDDGSFYGYLSEIGGSLNGAFVPDGSMFVGSLVDSSNRLMLVYGVRSFDSTKTTYLTSDGTTSGKAATYAFTNYRNDIFSIKRFQSPPADDVLRYLVAIGMAATNSQAFLGSSGDTNSVIVHNPAGDFGAPQAGSSIFSGNTETSLTQIYTAFGGGGIAGPSLIGLSGVVDEDGATMLFIRNTLTKDVFNCPNDFGFGLGLRQRPAGTFHADSVKGTYFVGGFGDRYNSTTMSSSHRSTVAALTFDGNGKARIEFIHNEMGSLSVNQLSLVYRVTSKFIPDYPGADARMAVDVVDLYDRVTSGPYASALIGNNGQTLAFFKGLNPGGQANPERLLGIALFQHP
jgi:hypothetical protein